MNILSSHQLTQKKCQPCREGTTAYSQAQAAEQLANLAGWHLTNDGKRICKQWKVKNFLSGLEFFSQVAEIAEQEGHHPDLHLTSYRDVSIEIWTHDIGGLSENDFIVAAKIDQLGV